MTLTSTLALLFGIFLGGVGYAAVLLVIGANRKPAEPPMKERNLFVEMFDELSTRGAREDDRMRSLSVKAPVTDWDVAQAAEQEPGVRYEWINLTGEER
jgi:hypothetical protein